MQPTRKNAHHSGEAGEGLKKNHCSHPTFNASQTGCAVIYASFALFPSWFSSGEPAPALSRLHHTFEMDEKKVENLPHDTAAAR